MAYRKGSKSGPRLCFENKYGFTLVELMVVVAIIGILSAVAIPNFKKYQAKSKTSEAKLQLAAIYTNETTFMGDYDTYGTCLSFMGFSVPSQGTYYAIGFNADAATANANADNNGAGGCVAAGTGLNVRAWDATKRVGGNNAVIADLGTNAAQALAEAALKLAADPLYTVPPNCSVEDTRGTSFIACAIGIVSSDRATAATQYSFWSMNEDKQLFEEQRGY